MCKTGEYNLSWDCLTSRNTLQELCNIERNCPEDWSKINLCAGASEEPESDRDEEEENELLDDDKDDSAVPLDSLQDWLESSNNDNSDNKDTEPDEMGHKVVQSDEHGAGMTLGGMAEDPFDKEAFDWNGIDQENRAKAEAEAAELEGLGKRKRTAPKRFNDFYRH